jgi:hypothetical protein
MLSALMLVLHVASSPPPHVREDERLASEEQTCCRSTGCEVQSALTPCEIDPPTTLPRRPQVDEAQLRQELWELTAPIEAVAAATGQTVTARGALIRVLTDPGIAAVVVGAIEGEAAIRRTDPDTGASTIMTVCSVRVYDVLRGRLREGELVDVLYRGGVISPTEWVIVHDLPRCGPGDYGTFTLLDTQVGWRIADRGTISMMASETPWEEHPLTSLGRELAASVGSLP